MLEDECTLCQLYRLQQHGKMEELNNYDVLKDARARCDICGKYSISEGALEEICSKNLGVHLLQGYTREMEEKGIKVSKITIAKLRSLFESSVIPKTIPEKLDRLLLNFERSSAYGGEIIFFDFEKDYPLGFALNGEEFDYLLRELDRLGYVEITEEANGALMAKIVTQGWSKIEELKRIVKDSKQCFVAMAFNDKTKQVREALRAGIEAAGFEPIIADEGEYTGNVMDFVLGQIRKSRFVIADYTVEPEEKTEMEGSDEPENSPIKKGTRGGVYYEAGYAKGVGLQVIQTCKADNISRNRLHFDIAQEFTIYWTDEDVKDIHVRRSSEERGEHTSAKNLAEKIYDRIIANFS